MRVGHYVDGTGADTASFGLIIQDARIDNCDCGTYEQMLLVNQHAYHITNPRFENNTNSLAYELMLYISSRNATIDNPHFDSSNAHAIGIMDSQGVTINDISASFTGDFSLVTFINSKDVSINRITGTILASSPTASAFNFFDRLLGPDGFTQIVDDTSYMSISDVNLIGWKGVANAQIAGSYLGTDYTMNQHHVRFENITVSGMSIPFNLGIDNVANTMHDFDFNNVQILDWTGITAGAFQLRGYTSNVAAMSGFRFRNCKIVPSSGVGSNAAIRAIAMTVESVQGCDLTGTFTGYGALSSASGGVTTKQFIISV